MVYKELMAIRGLLVIPDLVASQVTLVLPVLLAPLELQAVSESLGKRALPERVDRAVDQGELELRDLSARQAQRDFEEIVEMRALPVSLDQWEQWEPQDHRVLLEMKVVPVSQADQEERVQLEK